MSGWTHRRRRQSARVPGEYLKARRFPSPPPARPPPPACAPERKRDVTHALLSGAVLSNTSRAQKYLSKRSF